MWIYSHLIHIIIGKQNCYNCLIFKQICYTIFILVWRRGQVPLHLFLDFMKKRAYIFVDWWFLYKSIKEAYWGIKYDLKKVCDLITWNRNLVWISYYVWEIDTHMWKTKKEKEGYKALRIKQQKFLSKLKEMWIEYRLWYFNKTKSKKRVNTFSGSCGPEAFF